MLLLLLIETFTVANVMVVCRRLFDVAIDFKNESLALFAVAVVVTRDFSFMGRLARHTTHQP